jgi:GntR family transcriptional regulator
MMETNGVDRSIPTPLYFQLKQILQDAIETGDLKVGDAIPTEMELVNQYGLSRATVRQAVLQLVNEGYLHREKGKGTFVTPPPAKIPLLESLRWFSGEMARKGILHGTRVLEQSIIPVPERPAECLKVAVGTTIFFLKRLRLLNDRPYLIDRHYIPYELCRGIERHDLEHVSLYKTLMEEYGFDLHHGWRELQPVIPAKEDIDLLGIYASTPLLYVESTVSDRDGKPLDYFEAKIHGKFTADIVNANELTGWSR